VAVLAKTRLEEFIECFQGNNEVYLKIKDTIKQEIEYTLSDPRQLLKIALVSLIESSRKDPRRFYALYYNKDITAETLAGQASSTISYDGQYSHMLLILQDVTEVV
jgi:hypothetical protein